MPVISALLLIAALAQTGPTASGIEAFRQGRFAAAREKLEHALATDPHDAAAHAFLAMTKAATGDCAPAAGEAEKQGELSFVRMAGLAAVECYAHANRAADAFALLGKLLTRFPEDPDTLYESAKMHRKSWDMAIQTLFARAPSSYRVNQLSGEVFESQGKYEEAAAQYAQASEKAPDALDLHYRRGRCLLLGSPSPETFQQALLEFQQELKLNPADAFAEYQLGQVFSAQRQPSDAVIHFQKAIQLRPDFPEALIAAGKIAAQNKRYEEAIGLFEKAIAIQPDSEAGRYNLMLADRNAGRADEALKQKRELDRLQKPPEGEFTEFLKKLGDKAPAK